MRATRFSGLLLVAGAAALAGCATLSSKDNGAWGRAYSGVRCVGTEDYWVTLSKQGSNGTQLLYKSVDYLFSAVMDTALLPVDLIAAGVNKLAKSAPGPLCNDISHVSPGVP